MTSLASRVVRRIVTHLRTSSHSQQATFSDIFRTNAWGDAERVAGPGSTRERALISKRTSVAARSLARGIDRRRAMRRLQLDTRCPRAARRAVHRHRHRRATDCRNTRRHAARNRRFLCLDMTRAALPEADMIIYRDGLVHLSFTDAKAAVRNFRRSGSKYLLVPIHRASPEPQRADRWLASAESRGDPVPLPAPLALVDERCTQTGGISRQATRALGAGVARPLTQLAIT